MRFNIAILGSFFFSLSAVAGNFDEAAKRTILKNASALALHQDGRMSQTVVDLVNISNLKSLEKGSTLNFGTVMTLQQFDCQTVDPDSKFQCQIEILYCIPQNQRPPALNTI